MPNVMVALSYIGGALCSTPQSLADAHYEWLRRWTCNSQVASSIPARRCRVTTLGKVVYTHVPQQVAVV